MANHSETFQAGGPAIPARPLDLSRARVSRRLRVDRLVRRLVTLGGLTIILSILAILFVIAAEVYPLFKPPTATVVGTTSVDGGASPLAVGVDEYREMAFLVNSSAIHFLSLREGKPVQAATIHGLNNAHMVGVSREGRGSFALGMSDGRVIPVEVKFAVSFPEGKRKVEPDLLINDPIVVDPGRRPISILSHVTTQGGPITAAVIDTKEVVLVTVRERKALIGPSTKEEFRQTLALPITGSVTSLVLDGRGEELFAGTSAGEIARVNVSDPVNPKVAEIVPVATHDRQPSGISVMGFLIGDRTLVVGDEAGGVSSWQLVQRGGAERRLQKVYDFTPHPRAVVAFSASRRDKGFLTADTGGVHLNYGTTGQTLLTADPRGGAVRAIAFAPKADGFVTMEGGNRLAHWGLDNPHPEITWRSLFGKVWYEGYAEPEYVWQSTGGTDDFEAKFSLSPLVFGTLKGTLYGLLFAIPLALLSALYASQFMHPTVKGYVKPAVEIMAALPSVVLGFIAGLWLAPMVERVVPGLFLLPLVVTVLILLSVMTWRFFPLPIRKWFKPGTEVFLLVPVAIGSAWLAFALGGLVESALLGGDYRGWLLRALGLTYDQRNSMVVGIAMGFAVIPIIFTIAEDSLSNVPQHLTAGSLALGATRWQTALRVVLPTASPGIFSAIMIGFGRAVGETMIVLMATGNTPVMDWSIFNGFRALSANIAVELPEAPEGGTLYRVLFLAAFLLFLMTFVVNTVAELVRLRLRKKYRAL